MNRRSLRLMAEYECFPIWEMDKDGLLNLAPEQLKISNELKIELGAWAAAWNRTYKRDDPAESGFSDERSTQCFDACGHQIWLKLRNELGKSFDVQYYSIVANALLST